jgi:drug/metabolite transporter (DMT)-like permease
MTNRIWLILCLASFACGYYVNDRLMRSRIEAETLTLYRTGIANGIRDGWFIVNEEKLEKQK